MTRPGLLCAAVLAVVVLAGGCGAGQATTAQQAVVGGVVATRSVAPPAPSTPVTPPRILPASVRIPSIGATSTLLPLALNPDGTVQVPPVSTPMQAGWYEGSSAPGQAGPAVLLGHVDGDSQAGIFYRLHELVRGDQVLVTRVDGSVEKFTVTKVARVTKDSFPTNAVYGPTKDSELRLVTCGGAFDHTTHHYVDNLIVYATLAT
jgi:LPXTG-site transpeptidase (sortase) family protein